MTRTTDLPDQPQPWTTVEETIEQELMLVLDEEAGGQQRGAVDWYQDSREYTLPRECMPHWRTLH